MAVSLGTGSVLLIGAIEDDRQKVVKDDHQQRESRGLVQLRLLLEDDTQESSLYIAEGTSHFLRLEKVLLRVWRNP